MSQDPAIEMGSSVSKPLSVVVGGAGFGLLLAAAGFAYFRARKPSATEVVEKVTASRRGFGLPVNLKGKWALTAAIRIIEHDSSRKVLLGVLKAMAKRSR